MTAPSSAPVTPLTGHFGAATEQVLRVAAHEGNPGHILKVLSPHAGNIHGMGPGIGRDPRDCHYWARERYFYEAHDSGELGVWSDGPLRPPALLGVTEGPDGAVTLALEDVAEPYERWSLTDYREVAEHLGAFNGARLHAASQDPPEWMSRGWLRWWFGSTVPATISALRTLTPRARTAVSDVLDPVAAVARTTRIWRSRTALLDRLDAAPVALGHLDANRLNLLRVSPDRTVAVDWSYTGMEALGADAAQLFASSAARLLIPAGELGIYHDAVLEGYLAGLRSAGVPVRVLAGVPAWYDLAICLRWGATHLFWVRRVADPELLAVLEERWWSRTYDSAAPGLALLDAYLAALTEEVLR